MQNGITSQLPQSGNDAPVLGNNVSKPGNATPMPGNYASIVGSNGLSIPQFNGFYLLLFTSPRLIVSC